MYRGHASAVTALKLWGDGLAVSCSAHNNIICVWRIVRPEVATKESDADADVFDTRSERSLETPVSIDDK
jgi:hypothetical protein